MITTDVIPEEIIELSRELSEVGAELYLVGGSVRDIFLEINPEEFDFEIFGNEVKKKEYLLMPEEEKDIFIEDFVFQVKRILEKLGKTNETGKSFGVIKIEKKPYDFSFPRKENKAGITRKDYEISLNPFLDFQTAQRRRDITINSILYSVNNKNIIDTFQGVEDLHQGIIRHVEKSTFSEDPLRVYRIAQFVSRLGFKVDAETIKLSKEFDVSTLSIDRISWEIDKLFKGKYIFEGIHFLYDSEVLCKRHKKLKELFDVSEESVVRKGLNFITNKMDLSDRITFFLISLMEKVEIKDVKKNSKDILETLLNNKKIISEVLLNLSYLEVLIGYSREEIKTSEALLILSNKKNVFLKSIFNCWRCLNHNGIFLEKEKVESLLDCIEDFKPLIKGKDLLEAGITPSERYKLLINKSIELQLQGFNKEVILHKLRSIEGVEKN